MSKANRDPITNRRRFLRLAGTTATASALLSAAAVIASDPDAGLRALVARWQAQEDEINTPMPGLSEAASDARIDVLADRMGDLADEIADTPALTIAGALLKLRVSMTILAQSRTTHTAD